MIETKHIGRKTWHELFPFRSVEFGRDRRTGRDNGMRFRVNIGNGEVLLSVSADLLTQICRTHRLGTAAEIEHHLLAVIELSHDGIAQFAGAVKRKS